MIAKRLISFPIVIRGLPCAVQHFRRRSRRGINEVNLCVCVCVYIFVCTNSVNQQE